MLTTTETTVILGTIKVRFDLAGEELKPRTRSREVSWIKYELSQEDENYEELGLMELRISPSNFASEDYPEVLEVTIIAKNQEDGDAPSSDD